MRQLFLSTNKVAVTIALTMLVLQAVAQNPNPRHWEEITYDTDRKVLIMFGGGEPDFLENNPKEYNNIFEWDGKTWKNIQLPGPAGISAHCFLYNSKEKVTVLIGGALKYPDDGSSLGAWSWNGKAWKQLDTVCPLRSIEAAYDPANNRILVYGKRHDKSDTGPGSNKWELWQFKDNSWQKLSDEGPVFTESFSPYEVSFDIKRNALILPWWENGKTIIWEWKNEKWQKIDCAGDCPPVKDYYTLAYHEKENITYLFSGRGSNRGFLDNFWKWNGTQWTKIETGVLPSARAAAKMEYGNGSLYLYGGVVGWGLTNEIWQWKEGHWKLMNPEYAVSAERKEKLLTAHIEANPNDAGASRSYANLLKSSNRNSEAEVNFKKAFSLKPTDFYYLFDLLQILYANGKTEEAGSFLSSAINAGNISSYERLGLMLFANNRYDEGTRCFAKAVELQPTGDNYYNLACGYAKLGNTDKAFEALNHAVEKGLNSKQQFETDTDLQSLRPDTRWKTLSEKLK